MVKDKGNIILDIENENDKLLLSIFNDLIKKPVIVYDYKDKKDKWGLISTLIGQKCQKLFDSEIPQNGLMFPTGSSRYHRLGFIARPINVKIDINPYKTSETKKKVWFNRKLF